MKRENTDFSLEDLARLPELYHPIVSPDGDRVAFYYDETGRNELYVFHREKEEYECLTDGEAPRDANWLMRWSSESDCIYFHRDNNGDEQYDILSATLEGSVETVIDVDGKAVLKDVTNDSESLLYASDEGEQQNLYRYDHETGETDQLTDYDQPISGGRFSPSGDRIAYLANETTNLDNLDLYLMTADGSDTRRLVVGTDRSTVGFGDWFPDGERLLISDDSDGFRKVGVYDIGTETVTWLESEDADCEREESAVAVGPRGDVAVVVRNRHGARMPVVYDIETVDGRELAVPEGFLSLSTSLGGLFVDSSTMVFAHSSAAKRKQLYEYDLEVDEPRVLLESSYGDIDPSTFVDAEFVTYRSEDGLTIGGLLYDPRDGELSETTDVPGIVSVHGGPHSQAYRRFDIYAQFLASRGYAVFQPNYRGSTGRGQEFKNEIHGDWGGMEQADIAAGGRWLMARDWIDEDQVAVFGASYGGYSVYCQLTQYPQLWTTGVAWMGITDLHQLYDNVAPYIQHYLQMQMGDSDENYDLWRERSPIEHVDEMERPVLVLHGVNDPRCPVEQARLFRDELRARGWEMGTDFEYRELGEEGHASTDIQRKIRVFELLDEYLDRQL